MRHAQSEYNVNSLINQDPKIKVNITEMGKKQAREVGKELKKKNFEIVFVSDFLRVKQTAELVKGERKIEMIIDKRLNEFKLGFEGQSAEVYYDLRRKSGNVLNYKGNENSESFVDLVNRVKGFVNYLKENKERYSCVLVVTHEAVIQALKVILLKIDEKKAYLTPFGNCKYFEVKI